VAILAGGVTLYEACALGVPAVAVPLSRHQHITVRGIARAGAAIDAGRLPAEGGSHSAYGAAGSSRRRGSGGSRPVERAVREAERLLGDAAARRRMSRAGRRLVDGHGAFRVAERLRRLPAALAASLERAAS
jgi:spore coat polysaccharide biosynthesis predicted glycosyltransferase SpsG